MGSDHSRDPPEDPLVTPLRVDEEEREGEEGGEGDEHGELVEAHRLDHFESGAIGVSVVACLLARRLAPLVVVLGRRAAFGHGAVWGKWSVNLRQRMEGNDNCKST